MNLFISISEKLYNLLHKKLEKNPSLLWTFLHGSLKRSQLSSCYLPISKINKQKLEPARDIMIPDILEGH